CRAGQGIRDDSFGQAVFMLRHVANYALSRAVPESGNRIASPRVLKVPAHRSTLNRHQYVLIKRVHRLFLSAAHGGKKAVQISKKTKFVADGIFKAELNERPCCAEGLLWCAAVHRGEWGRRLRGRVGTLLTTVSMLPCAMCCSDRVLGITVKIMPPWDPTGKTGPKKPLPDHVSIVGPKDEILPTTSISEQKGGKPEPPAMPQPVPTA
ncbi:hypothetical protein E2I00_010623, partial [Balaenoptera physalus]